MTEQTDANLLHRMMQCLATKNENENNVQINPKILSLVYTKLFECVPVHKLNRNACLYLLICNKISSIAKKKYIMTLLKVN